MNTCKITFFASLSDKIGKQNDIIQADWKIGDETKNYFKKKYPILQNMSFSVAVNMELAEVFETDKIDEIILLPPFAGG